MYSGSWYIKSLTASLNTLKLKCHFKKFKCMVVNAAGTTHTPLPWLKVTAVSPPFCTIHANMEHVNKFFLLFACDSVNCTLQGLPGSSAGKESACSAGNTGLILGLKRSLGGGHGNPLEYSCLQNPHGQRSLRGYSPWGCRVEHHWATKHSTLQIISLNLWFLFSCLLKRFSI